jgi:hypothetical protein
MKMITDEDLTLLYYGEHEDPALAATVAESAELSARYEALCAELKLADAYQPPLRDDDYGAQVWQRISPRLAGEKSSSGSRVTNWLTTLVQPRFSLAGALSIALVAALAFTLGRNGGPESNNKPVTPSGLAGATVVAIDSSRLLNHSVSAHLEQVNILLTQFVNTSETSSGETGHVTDLLVANRLYRQAAVVEGNQKLAAFLADLEPLLIELAYQAQSGSTASRERMQQEVKDGLLFRVRVMNQQLNKSEISV